MMPVRVLNVLVGHGLCIINVEMCQLVLLSLPYWCLQHSLLFRIFAVQTDAKSLRRRNSGIERVYFSDRIDRMYRLGPLNKKSCDDLFHFVSGASVNRVCCDTCLDVGFV